MKTTKKYLSKGLTSNPKKMSSLQGNPQIEEIEKLIKISISYKIISIK